MSIERDENDGIKESEIISKAPEMGRCDQCRFWLDVNEDEEFGFCHRHAPLPVYVAEGTKMINSLDNDDYYVYWPKTFSADTCGDILSKTAPAKQAPLCFGKESKMGKKGIREVRYISLNEIRVMGETMSRSSLVEAVEKKGFKAAMADPDFAMAALCDSMKADGQMEAIGVRRMNIPAPLLTEEGLTGLYQLIFGLRRFFAARILGWEKIKAVVLY